MNFIDILYMYNNNVHYKHFTLFQQISSGNKKVTCTETVDTITLLLLPVSELDSI